MLKSNHQTTPYSSPFIKTMVSAVYEDKTASFRDSAFNGNKKLPFHRWVPWIAGFSSNFVEDCFRNYLDPSIPSVRRYHP